MSSWMNSGEKKKTSEAKASLSTQASELWSSAGSSAWSLFDGAAKEVVSLPGSLEAHSSSYMRGRSHTLTPDHVADVEDDHHDDAESWSSEDRATLSAAREEEHKELDAQTAHTQGMLWHVQIVADDYNDARPSVGAQVV